jgi:hypothetical protein
VVVVVVFVFGVWCVCVCACAHACTRACVCGTHIIAVTSRDDFSNLLLVQPRLRPEERSQFLVLTFPIRENPVLLKIPVVVLVLVLTMP